MLPKSADFGKVSDAGNTFVGKAMCLAPCVGIVRIRWEGAGLSQPPGSAPLPFLAAKLQLFRHIRNFFHFADAGSVRPYVPQFLVYTLSTFAVFVADYDLAPVDEHGNHTVDEVLVAQLPAMFELDFEPHGYGVGHPLHHGV